MKAILHHAWGLKKVHESPFSLQEGKDHGSGIRRISMTCKQPKLYYCANFFHGDYSLNSDAIGMCCFSSGTNHEFLLRFTLISVLSPSALQLLILENSEAVSHRLNCCVSNKELYT